MKHGETPAFLPPLASATASFRAFDVVCRFRSGFRGLPAVSSQRLQLGGGASGVVRRHVSGKNLLGKHKKHRLREKIQNCFGNLFSVFGTFGGICFSARFPCYLQHLGAGSCHFNCPCNILELEPFIFYRVCNILVEFVTFWSWKLRFKGICSIFEFEPLIFDGICNILVLELLM